jgi:hypothetical protein
MTGWGVGCMQWLGVGTPTEFRVPDSIEPSRNRRPHVGYGVLWQRVEWEPLEFIALVWLDVLRLAPPNRRMEEKRDSLLVGVAVYDMAERQVRCSDLPAR